MIQFRLMYSVDVFILLTFIGEMSSPTSSWERKAFQHHAGTRTCTPRRPQRREPRWGSCHWAVSPVVASPFPGTTCSYADVHGLGLHTACVVVHNGLGFHGHLGLYTNSVEIYTIKPFIRNPHCFQSQQSNGMFMLKACGEPNKECTMYISRLGYEPCDWLIIISYYCYHFETTLWLLVGIAELQSLRMIRHFQIFYSWEQLTPTKNPNPIYVSKLMYYWELTTY